MSKKEAMSGLKLGPGTNLITTGDKGGVGKTFVMQAFLARCASLGFIPLIIEFDESPRLQDLYGVSRCHSFTLNPKTLRDVEDNPEVLYQLWDNAMQIARESKAPVAWDFGSNGMKPFADYLIEQQFAGFFGRGERTAVFGITTGNPAAVAAVQVSLGYAQQALPEARRAVIFNDNDTNFQVRRGAAAISRLAEACGCPGFYLEKIGAKEALSRAIERKVSLEEMAIKDVEYWESLGLLPDAAVRAQLRIQNYVVEAGAILDEVLHGAKLDTPAN